MLWKPDIDSLELTQKVWFHLAAVIVMLLAYGRLYEPLGFIVSTAIFDTILARMLGAPRWRALAFGIAAGILGWLLCVSLMDLNPPEGALIEALLERFETEAN